MDWAVFFGLIAVFFVLWLVFLVLAMATPVLSSIPGTILVLFSWVLYSPAFTVLESTSIPLATIWFPTNLVICSVPLSFIVLAIGTMAPTALTFGGPAFTLLAVLVLFIGGILVSDVIMFLFATIAPVFVIGIFSIIILFPTYCCLMILSGASGGLAQTGQTGQTEGSNIYGSTLYAYT